VLDEAAQVEDAKLFIVLSRCPQLEKAVLVGDPKQLQPYVSDTVRQQGWGVSTMERLMAVKGTCFVMLEQQFRMPPLVRALVSECFYDGRLTDDKCVLERGPAKNLRLKPLVVVDVTAASMQWNALHRSYENEGEAEVVRLIYKFILENSGFMDLPGGADIAEADVCVLTPFNRHKDRLRMEICGIEEEDLSQHEVFRRGGIKEENLSQCENIDTVDKFQGSERRVVIVSTCVDKTPLRAGDPHFVNVACSRASALLVVVGNFEKALAPHDDNWAKVRELAKAQGNYLNVDCSKRKWGVELSGTLQGLLEFERKKRRKN